MNRSPQSTLLTDGIVAVVTTSTIAADQLVPGILGEAGPEPLVSVARATAELFKHTDELALRVVLKEHTISAKRRLDGDDETITVLVVVTGHPIVKSLARTLRAILKAAKGKPSVTIAGKKMPVVDGAMSWSAVPEGFYIDDQSSDEAEAFVGSHADGWCGPRRDAISDAAADCRDEAKRRAS